MGVLLAVSIAMALFWSGWRYSRVNTNSKVPPGALVYLAPVKNETGQKALDNMTELIRAGLSQSVQINLLDQSRVGDTLQRMTKMPDTVIDEPTAREIAMRTGAVRVVFADAHGSGGRFWVDVDIQQMDNSPERARRDWKRSFAWQADPAVAGDSIPASLLNAVRDASDWIRREVGESAEDIGTLNGAPEDVTTRDWEALADYAKAEKLQAAEETTEAVVALREAVRRDPQFSLALGRLGDLLYSTGNYREGYEAYQRALEGGEDRRFSRKERDRIAGEFAMDTGDYAAAEQAYRDMTVYYVNDYVGWSYRGFPLMMLGRTQESIPSLERAYAIDAYRTNAPWELARAYLLLGNLTEARRWASTLEKHALPETAGYIYGAASFIEHDYGAADRWFRSMENARNPVLHSWSFELRARVAAELGQYGSAKELLTAGIAADAQSGQAAYEAKKYLGRAYVDALSGDTDACVADVRAGIALDASPQLLTVASLTLGNAAALAGGPEARRLRDALHQVESLLSRKPLGVVGQIAAYRVHGEALLADGNPSSAMGLFRKASQLDAVMSGREYLGRALMAASLRVRDAAAAERLRREALDAYGVLALQPGLLWLDTPDALPGIYVRQLKAYEQIAAELHRSDGKARQAAGELKFLREGNLSSLNATKH
jgi:tetratricopeptide (TPR) repeat protein